MIKAKKPRQYPEHELQLKCVRRLRDLETLGFLKFFAVPNGVDIGAWKGHRERSRGLVAGVPDLVIIDARERRVLFVELKSAKGSLSEPQKVWADWLVRMGYPWSEVRSLRALDLALELHLDIK